MSKNKRTLSSDALGFYIYLDVDNITDSDRL